MPYNVLFIYESAHPVTVKDGLWKALHILNESREFEITWWNLSGNTKNPSDEYDFILAWGGFSSRPDLKAREFKHRKTGLCIGGNAIPPYELDAYDVLFYETEWYKPQIKDHQNIVHAFGVNTEIYQKQEMPKIWDYISVGALASWKRQHRLLEKKGNRIVVGEIQKGNLDESFGIAGMLLEQGVAVSDMVSPETLNLMYNASKVCFIPASVNGGGERAVLEARACGIDVEIEPDNPKLAELLESPLYNHIYYAQKLKEGILSCLN